MFLAYPGAYPTEPIHQESAEVLARAFHDDPGFVYMMPNARMRLKKLTWWWSIQLRYTYRYGLVFRMVSETSKTLGLALWLPPSYPYISELQIMRLGMVAAPLHLSLPEILRAQELGNQWMRTHQANMPAPHWYLLGLGVDPSCQGKGIGGQLLQPILRRAGDEQLPCYLETTRSINVQFYQKHGFEIAQEYRLASTSNPCWGMSRPPDAEVGAGVRSGAAGQTEPVVLADPVPA